ncbi:hypothetical protein AbraIFM66950_003665, partial [Aspergillus brasiliensis]
RLGEFRSTLIRQWEVLKGLQNRDDPLKCCDEGVVNGSLVTLLQILLSLHPTPASEWSIAKTRLRGTFGSLRSDTKTLHLDVLTDGQLKDKRTGEIKSVLKCKEDIRIHRSPTVDMQEAAEIVAWVSQYPDNDRSVNTHQ